LLLFVACRLRCSTSVASASDGLAVGQQLVLRLPNRAPICLSLGSVGGRQAVAQGGNILAIGTVLRHYADAETLEDVRVVAIELASSNDVARSSSRIVRC
jgi:hypothetical protein